jgi:hypothetical protein
MPRQTRFLLSLPQSSNSNAVEIQKNEFNLEMIKQGKGRSSWQQRQVFQVPPASPLVAPNSATYFLTKL